MGERGHTQSGGHSRMHDLFWLQGWRKPKRVHVLYDVTHLIVHILYDLLANTLSDEQHVLAAMRMTENLAAVQNLHYTPRWRRKAREGHSHGHAQSGECNIHLLPSLF